MTEPCGHLNLNPTPSPEWTCVDCGTRLTNDEVREVLNRHQETVDMPSGKDA